MSAAASGKCWAKWKLKLKDNFFTFDKVNILLYLKEGIKVLLYLKETLEKFTSLPKPKKTYFFTQKRKRLENTPEPKG